MKVCFSGVKQVSQDELMVMSDFVKFLQREVPLKKDIYVLLTDKRNVPMTTGVRFPGHKIVVLVGKRLLIDILRTLSHEWVHEFQHQKLGVPEQEKIQDIGGPEENMANALSGVFVKLFEKKFPNYTKLMYGED